MNITDGRVTVETNAVTPTLKLTATLRYASTDLPVVVDGGMQTETGQLLSPLHAEPRANQYHQYLRAESDSDRSESHLPLAFWVPLSARHLEAIELLREKNRKRDVVLKATLSVTYQRFKPELVDLSTQIRHVDEPNTAGKRVRRVGEAFPRDSGPKHTGPTVLSTRSSIIEQTTYTQAIGAIIPGSDWINDFSPALGRGRFLVVEIPDPSGHHVPEDLRARFAKAAESIAASRQKLIAGEWSDACRELRALFEVLRSWTELEALIEADYGPDAARAFAQGLRSFFEFSSKFLHPLAKDGKTLNPSETATKEDAQLLFALSASTLNGIGRKWARMTAAE